MPQKNKGGAAKEPEESVEDIKRKQKEIQAARMREKLEDLERKSPSPAKSKREKRVKLDSAKAAASSSPKTRKVVSKYNSFILDCDGVLWHGDDPIEGSIEACKMLLDNGCKIHLVTNSSGNSRTAVADKLKRMGLPGVSADDVTTSGSAAAALIKSEYPKAKKVYAVGERSLLEELKAVDLVVLGGPEDGSIVAANSKQFQELEIDKDVDIVVCGLDRSFNYGKLCKASLYLQKGCPLVCTNYDAYDVLPSKGNVPGAGCIVSCLRASHPSVEPILAGKPSANVLLDIIKHRKMTKDTCVMIGDRLDTDIESARNAEVDSCLVLTGVVGSSSSSSDACHATYTEASLFDFVKRQFAMDLNE